MSLIPWQPIKELDTLRHRINQLLDEWMHHEAGLTPFHTREDGLWAPAIELKETDTELILKAEVPGIEAKELNVQVSENMVSIAGEHREEKRMEEAGVLRSELRYGQFQRTIPLPMLVKNNEVKAKFRDGVLTLTLPKADSTRRNVVKIDLTLQEQAREAATQQRQHDERLQEKAHRRMATEIGTSAS